MRAIDNVSMKTGQDNFNFNNMSMRTTILSTSNKGSIISSSLKKERKLQIKKINKVVYSGILINSIDAENI